MDEMVTVRIARTCCLLAAAGLLAGCTGSAVQPQHPLAWAEPPIKDAYLPKPTPTGSVGIRIGVTDTIGMEYEHGGSMGGGADRTAYFLMTGFMNRTPGEDQARHNQYGGGVRLYRRPDLRGAYISLMGSRMDIRYDRENVGEADGSAFGFTTTLGYRWRFLYAEAGVAIWDVSRIQVVGGPGPGTVYDYQDMSGALQPVMPAVNFGMVLQF
jgi:hypothetical protein